MEAATILEAQRALVGRVLVDLIMQAEMLLRTEAVVAEALLAVRLADLVVPAS